MKLISSKGNLRMREGMEKRIKWLSHCKLVVVMHKILEKENIFGFLFFSARTTKRRVQQYEKGVREVQERIREFAY